MKSEHQKETAFLRHCIRYEESPRRQELDQRIAKIQRDERSIHRAVWLMVVLGALAVAGFGYGVVLVDNFPYNAPQIVINVIFALAAGAVICGLTFVGLRMVYRLKLDRRREECRQLVTRLLESRLGRPAPLPLHPIRAAAAEVRTVLVVGEAPGASVKIETAAQG